MHNAQNFQNSRGHVSQCPIGSDATAGMGLGLDVIRSCGLLHLALSLLVWLSLDLRSSGLCLCRERRRAARSGLNETVELQESSPEVEVYVLPYACCAFSVLQQMMTTT